MYKNISSGEIIENKEYLAMVQAEAREEFEDNKEDYVADGIKSANELYKKYLLEPDGDFSPVLDKAVKGNETIYLSEQDEQKGLDVKLDMEGYKVTAI